MFGTFHLSYVIASEIESPVPIEMTSFARWRHFTTTTRILYVFPFIFKFGLNDKTPKLHSKAKPWRILVVVVRWRHRASGPSRKVFFVPWERMQFNTNTPLIWALSMVPSVSVLTGFDSLSRFTDTSLLRTVCIVPEERKPLQFLYHYACQVH